MKLLKKISAIGSTVGLLVMPFVTKALDSASPLLMKAGAAGTNLGTVVLSAERNSSPPFSYLALTINNARVRSVKVSAAQATGVGETVGFSFTAITFAYTRQNPTGSSTVISACWNLATHVAC